MRVLFLLAFASLAATAQTAKTPKPHSKPIDFIRDVKPLLSDRCFACHGPDEGARMAKLRLDTEEGARQVIESGKMVARIAHEKKALRMPPPNAPELTPQQIATLKSWVEQGAPWKEHWSYIPPKTPALPEVKNDKWVRNEIDRFVLAKLGDEGLAPSPHADKATLLRRVTFDLTGLPPTTEELKAFLADRSPDAYEKVVDRLLASPRYGERMAIPWLDMARYADTHGYHIDSHRDMWPWRDWIISAFNKNLPYDQFLRWQLAGDLLPNPTRDQLIATGFNRNHMINYEGGAIPEEYHVEYVVDRVEATSTAFLGLTVGCARCHDHKYDPIRQKEFYEFFAFFNTVNEKGLDGQRGNAQPFLLLPDDDQQKQLDRLDAKIVELEDSLERADVRELRQGWEKQQGTAYPDSPREGLLGHYPFDGSLADVSGNYRHGRGTKGEAAFSPGAADRAVSLDDRTTIDLPALAEPAAASFAFWSKVSARLDTQPSTLVQGSRFRLWIDGGRAIGQNRRGSSFWLSVDDKVFRSEEVVTGAWIHAAVNLQPEPALFLDGKPVKLTPVTESIPKPWIRASLDDLRVYSRPLAAQEIETLAERFPVYVTLSIPSGKRSLDQRLALLDYFFEHGAPAEVRETNQALQDLYRKRDDVKLDIPTTMVMSEMAIPRETKILARGDYRNGTDVVEPGVPSFLPPLPKSAPKNRLGLADWLTSPEHPLTSRVAVNRFWQMFFGQGIVKTVEDFGSQGEYPSHPQLLDWLATEFMRSGWDVKALQKKIVLSATYQQSSRIPPALLEKDPENRLLARGPRYRLPAELIRDNALAVSGLLNDKIGGPSVYPYQPKGVWEDIAYGDTFSSQIYVQDHGDKLYRRSLYSFWKRTAPPPGLATFDAPDREKCAAKRTLTNTPLQALVLLNDPAYIEASRGLAARMMTEGKKDPVEFAFRTVLAREPEKPERKVLAQQYKKQLGVYKNFPEGVEKLLQNGESTVGAGLDKPSLAAWTTVASVILNLDETITKE